MNPANLTAADRDTILAALKTERDFIRKTTGPVCGREEIAEIDALCERLSAPVAEPKIYCECGDEMGKGVCLGAGHVICKAQPPQAPEPVNAELLADKERLDWFDAAMLGSDPEQQLHKVRNGPLSEDITITMYNGRQTRDFTGPSIRNAIDAARAESALAAQKGGK